MHVGRAIIVHMDVKGFFEATSVERVRGYVTELMGGGDVEGVVEKATEHKLDLEEVPRIANTNPALPSFRNGISGLV